MPLQHWQMKVDPEHGSDVLLIPPAAGGGYRPSEAHRVSGELFYEFVCTGFAARGVAIWNLDDDEWLVPPKAEAA